MIVRPSLLDRDVAPFDPAKLAQSVDECINPLTVRVAPTRAKIPDGRQLARLLRARRQRPSRRSADERDELAPDHSITSSARRRIDVGNSRPIAFAVFKLTTSSNRVGCSTGSSAGVAPLRILATYSANRRKSDLMSIP